MQKGLGQLNRRFVLKWVSERVSEWANELISQFLDFDVPSTSQGHLRTNQLSSYTGLKRKSPYQKQKAYSQFWAQLVQRRSNPRHIERTSLKRWFYRMLAGLDRSSSRYIFLGVKEWFYRGLEVSNRIFSWVQNGEPYNVGLDVSDLRFFFTSTFTYPLTAGVVGTPQTTSQPVSSIFSVFSTALWDLANSRPVHTKTLLSVIKP